MVLTHVQFHRYHPQQSQQLQQQQQDQQYPTTHQQNLSKSNCKFTVFVIINIIVVLLVGWKLFVINLWLINPNQTELLESSTSDILQRALYFVSKETCDKIITNQLNVQIKQLPFCLLVMGNRNHYTQQDIMLSIGKLQYKNYAVIKGQKQEIIGKYKFDHYREKIIKQCGINAVVMFVSLPLLPSALFYLNQQYQIYNAWTMYTINQQNSKISKTQSTSQSKINLSQQNTIQIISCYNNILNFIHTNDPSSSNSPYLNSQSQQSNIQITTLSILQLSPQHILHINKFLIYNITNSHELSFLSVNNVKSNNKTQNIYKRIAYRKITKLSQDFQLDVINYQKYRFFYKTSQQIHERSLAQLTQQQMLFAIQRQQIPYLPKQHILNELQYEHYNKLYPIHKYLQKQQQLSFCITVLSHNNIQNNRYRNLVTTILQQKYENYRVVFIDDNSDDATMQQTIKLFKQHGFSKDRVNYIKNLQRRYATYNIVNANFNYCKEQQIQLLIDGDDQLIGSYVLSIFNAVYQQNKQLWAVYSNYKDSNFGFGRSQKITKQQQHYNYKENLRQYFVAIGAIRTWRVKLLYNIPMKYHTKQDGNWLDTVYDDALAHPILQLSTVKRVKYVPQILYEYNTGYGDNDNATPERANYRTKVYKWIQHLPSLDRLSTLDSSIKDKKIVNVLIQDYNKGYVQVQNL